MFRKTILATAAAGMLAAGSLVAATSTASAHGPGGPGGSIQFGGPSWNLQIGGFGFGFGQPFPPQPPKFCKPIVKTVKWWDKWHRPHWSNVVVSYKCKPPFGGRHHGPWSGPGGPGFGPGPGGFGPGPGMGPGPGGFGPGPGGWGGW